MVFDCQEKRITYLLTYLPLVSFSDQDVCLRQRPLQLVVYQSYVSAIASHFSRCHHILLSNVNVTPIHSYQHEGGQETETVA